ncbi:MAG: hypothetical protein ABI200_04220, partial [Gaiellales bacterium]
MRARSRDTHADAGSYRVGVKVLGSKRLAGVVPACEDAGMRDDDHIDDDDDSSGEWPEAGLERPD